MLRSVLGKKGGKKRVAPPLPIRRSGWPRYPEPGGLRSPSREESNGVRCPSHLVCGSGWAGRAHTGYYLWARPGPAEAESSAGKGNRVVGRGDSAEMPPSADSWPRDCDLSTFLRMESTQIPLPLAPRRKGRGVRPGWRGAVMAG